MALTSRIAAGAMLLAAAVALATCGGGDTTSAGSGNPAPLYTFSEEGSGEVTGDGVKDAFDGEHFVWHVATPSDAGESSESTTDSQGGGYSY